MCSGKLHMSYMHACSLHTQSKRLQNPRPAQTGPRRHYCTTCAIRVHCAHHKALHAASCLAARPTGIVTTKPHNGSATVAFFRPQLLRPAKAWTLSLTFVMHATARTRRVLALKQAHACNTASRSFTGNPRTHVKTVVRRQRAIAKKFHHPQVVRQFRSPRVQVALRKKLLQLALPRLRSYRQMFPRAVPACMLTLAC